MAALQGAGHLILWVFFCLSVAHALLPHVVSSPAAPHHPAACNPALLRAQSSRPDALST